ncbi:hypothetical protein [Thioflavicoccus mobilis]|uniref:hypothetical protein n=1 Tax=Thioflavicoccus mobilis TaxID=80679 RepID=UPI0005A2CF14|nr:hypothetical protein [Thioflavicoccus mobilis]
MLGCVIGALGGAWGGLLGRLLLGQTPVSFSLLVEWASGVAILCGLLGILFPRIVTIVLYPLAIFGGGQS